MKLILLGGNSKENGPWCKKACNHLKNLFNEIRVLTYDHWKTGGEVLDIDAELNKLLQYNVDENSIVVAKSAGSAVIFKGVHDLRIHPFKCLFIGIPVYWARDKRIDLDKWIEGFKIPSIIIQNEEDPTIGAEELKSFLHDKKVEHYRLIPLAGKTHYYNNFDIIKGTVESLLKKC